MDRESLTNLYPLPQLTTSQKGADSTPVWLFRRARELSRRTEAIESVIVTLAGKGVLFRLLPLKNEVSLPAVFQPL
jgi:hypothetical protein